MYGPRGKSCYLAESNASFVLLWISRAWHSGLAANEPRLQDQVVAPPKSASDYHFPRFLISLNAFGFRRSNLPTANACHRPQWGN